MQILINGVATLDQTVGAPLWQVRYTQWDVIDTTFCFKEERDMNA